MAEVRGSGAARTTVTQRRARLVELLAARGEVSVSDLAAEADVSEITIRRDLRALEMSGAISRTYGHAKSVAPRPAMEELFSQRELRQPEAKRAIGHTAAALLAHCRSLAMNDGTTILQVAQRLAEAEPAMSVTTNACNVALVLAGASTIEVRLEGGLMRRSSFATFNPDDDPTAPRVDAVVLGVESLEQDGIHLGHAFDDAVARRFIARARRIVVVADATKWEQRGAILTCPWDAVGDLVTDSPVPAAHAGMLRRLGVQVHVASG